MPSSITQLYRLESPQDQGLSVRGVGVFIASCVTAKHKQKKRPVTVLSNWGTWYSEFGVVSLRRKQE
jgi:hypothetical protein